MAIKTAALKMGWRKRTFPALAGLLVMVVTATIHYMNPAIFSNYGNLLFDEFQRRKPREYVDMGVRVVNIDEESIRRIGQWPWPRPLIGKMTQNMVDAGAQVIAYDIVFSEPDRTSPENVVPVLIDAGADPSIADAFEGYQSHDEALGEVFSRLPVVLGFFFENSGVSETPSGCYGEAFGGTPSLDQVEPFLSATQTLGVIRENAGGSGFLSVNARQAGEDRFVRTAPLLASINEQICPALSISVLRYILQAGSYRVEFSSKSGETGNYNPEILGVRFPPFFFVPTTSRGELWMNYTKGRENRDIPAWKMLDDSVSLEERRALLEGNIAFVGAGAQGLNDLVATPLDPQLPGVFVHAQALEMMLLSYTEDLDEGPLFDTAFLIRPVWGPGIRFAAILLGGLILILIIPITAPLLSGLVGGTMVGGMFALSWFLYGKQGLLFDAVYPAIALSAIYAITTLVSFVVNEAEKSYIKGAFDRYLSPEMVEKIADDPSQLKLGGEEREMTILFSDIRGFSKISEGMTPQELTTYINNYLTPMTDILMSHKATVDKYIGDAIMSFWNAPIDDPLQHANAARSALVMMETLDAMNARVGKAEEGEEGVLAVETKIGIGLHSGMTSVGNMGSEQRFAYSVLGDTVNTSARLEGMTKQYGVGILIGDALAEKLPEFAVLEIDRVKAVGKDVPLTIFALIGDEAASQSEDYKKIVAAQTVFLEKYRNQEFDAALEMLDELEIVGESFNIARHYAIMRERIEVYRTDPPPTDWGGIYVLRSK